MFRFACLFLFLLVTFVSAEQSPAASCSTTVQAAESAVQTLLDNFWDTSINYFRQSWSSGNPTDNTQEFYWRYALGVDAVLDSIELSLNISNSRSVPATIQRHHQARLQSLMPWIQTFYSAQFESSNSAYSGYYDDECWMGNAFLRALNILLAAGGDSDLAQKCLSAAQELYTDVAAAWDTSCCGNNNGGLWWDKAHSQKATAANANAVILALNIYEVDKDNNKLDFANKVYHFWWDNMVENDHTCDHLNSDGTKVCDWIFTYNDGLMIGAASFLGKVTSNSTLLDQAGTIVKWVLSNQEVEQGSDGLVLTDGSNQACTGDCVEFKGPSFRYLRLFHEVTNDSNLRDQVNKLLTSSANSILSSAINTGKGTFSTSWTGPAPTDDETVLQGQQNSAAMALNIYGQMCSN